VKRDETELGRRDGLTQLALHSREDPPHRSSPFLQRAEPIAYRRTLDGRRQCEERQNLVTPWSILVSSPYNSPCEELKRMTTDRRVRAGHRGDRDVMWVPNNTPRKGTRSMSDDSISEASTLVYPLPDGVNRKQNPFSVYRERNRREGGDESLC
jgi:hypothetical protein